jgi:hypothetical protein
MTPIPSNEIEYVMLWCIVWSGTEFPTTHTSKYYQEKAHADDAIASWKDRRTNTNHMPTHMGKALCIKHENIFYSLGDPMQFNIENPSLSVV